MRSVARRTLARLVAVVACAGLLLAAGHAAAQSGGARYDRPALDAMLAPIALYPDGLLAQVLMAATYPDEIQEAAVWLRARPGLSGDAAVRSSLDQDWEPSVRSLLAFPMVLETLASHPRWTADLGEAFLAQRAEVMDTVQALRRRAYEAGTLRSNEAVEVSVTLSGIVIEQAAPETVYIPHYDPQVVYGGWWWPARPPVYWPRWPGYVDAVPGGHYLAWGPGIHVGSGFFFGGFVWPRHEVRVIHVRSYYYPRRIPERHVVPGRGPVIVHREARPGVWRHHEWRRHRDDGRADDRRDFRDHRGSAVTRSTLTPREGRADWNGRSDRDPRPDWNRDGDGRLDWSRRSDHDDDRRLDWNRDRDGDGRPDSNRRSDRDGDGRPERRYGTDFGRGERGGQDGWRAQRPDRDEGRARMPREGAREAPRATPREARPLPRARVDPGDRN